MSDKTVSFTAMKDGTREEYQMLHKLEKPHHTMTADRILRELAGQATETLPGYRITRLEHGLQSATRAENEGADIDWIVAALLHDIGDGLAPQNHDRFAAEIIRPFVREEVAWVVEHLAPGRVLVNNIYGPDDAFKVRMYAAYRPMFEFVAQEIIAPGIAQGIFRQVDVEATSSLLMTIYLGTASQVDDQGRTFLDPQQVASFALHALQCPAS